MCTFVWMTTWKTVLTFLSEYQYFSSKNSKIRHKSKWFFLHACYGCVSRHHIRDTYCRFQISYWHLGEAIVLEWTGYNWWTQKYLTNFCMLTLFVSTKCSAIPNFMDFTYYLKHNLNLEGLIAEMKGNTEAHENKWNVFTIL